MESLAPEAKVKRSGEWKTIEAAELVPGDVIAIKLGDVIPADGRLIAVSHFIFLLENEKIFWESSNVWFGTLIFPVLKID
jgi:magnesium-transporting ATPase (P-type)